MPSVLCRYWNLAANPAEWPVSQFLSSCAGRVRGVRKVQVRPLQGSLRALSKAVQGDVRAVQGDVRAALRQVQGRM